MREFEAGGKAYFSFTNRVAKPDAQGHVSLFELPAKRALVFSGYLDVAVLLAALASQCHPEAWHDSARLLFAIQGLHLVYKARFVWRLARVQAAMPLQGQPARATLQSEHTAFLLSFSLVLGQLWQGSGPVGSYLCALLMAVTAVALPMTRPCRKMLRVRG